mgnify:CR=1 FL=1
MSTVSNRPRLSGQIRRQQRQKLADNAAAKENNEAGGVDQSTVDQAVGASTSGAGLTKKISKLGDAMAGVSHAGSYVGVTGAAVGLGSAMKTATADTRQAVQSKSAEDINKAVGSTAQAASTTLAGASSAVDVAEVVAKRQASRRARKALLRANPHMSKAALRTETKKAVQNAASGVGLGGPRARTAADTGGVLGNRGQRAANRVASASLRANKLTHVAKTFGRFAPGVSAGIAVLDSAAFASTMNNPDASLGKKITSGITAAGSWVAATNIPFLAQGGAIVSGISGFAGTFF